VDALGTGLGVSGGAGRLDGLRDRLLSIVEVAEASNLPVLVKVISDSFNSPP